MSPTKCHPHNRECNFQGNKTLDTGSALPSFFLCGPVGHFLVRFSVDFLPSGEPRAVECETVTKGFMEKDCGGYCR